MSEHTIPDQRFLSGEFKRLARFAIVGTLNTAVGFSVVALLQFECGLGPLLSNAFGLVVGICFGFVLNARFVFERRVFRITALCRYVMAFVMALALEQILLAFLLSIGSHPIAAQGLSLMSYSLCYFLLCRTWIFAESHLAESLRGGHAR